MNAAERPGVTASVPIVRLMQGTARDDRDDVAAEEPLEIRVLIGGQTRPAAVTMRTPGRDFELATGFLFAEGIVRSREQLRDISYCLDSQTPATQHYNVVGVTLSGDAGGQFDRLERHFTMTSACGVCGKATIDALQTRAEPCDDGLTVDALLLGKLPERMRGAQRAFDSTGGLHAAALFDERGTLLRLREDVGRHNALDKLVGSMLLEQRIPLKRTIALVSGRASYELVQKCIVARIPILCAVSAPSSLAVRLAQAFGLTLCGFVRGDRANVYSAPERIAAAR